MFSTIIVNGNFNITLVVEILHLLAVKWSMCFLYLSRIGCLAPAIWTVFHDEWLIHCFVAVFCWGYCICYFVLLISIGFYVYVCFLMGLALSEEILSLCRFFQSGIKQQSLLHLTLTNVCYKWSPLWCHFNWTIVWVVLWLFTEK